MVKPVSFHLERFQRYSVLKKCTFLSHPVFVNKSKQNINQFNHIDYHLFHVNCTSLNKMYIVYAKIGLGDVEIIGLTEVVKGLKNQP